MKIDGLQLREGSSITNLTVNSGNDFPALPNLAEFFYLHNHVSLPSGLYEYTIDNEWVLITNSQNNAISMLNDIVLTDLTSGQTLVYNGTEWINSTVSGGSGSSESYIHTQSTLSDTWTIAHNLGNQFVHVTVINENNQIMIPNYINLISTNNVEIGFITPRTGVAVIGGSSTGGASGGGSDKIFYENDSLVTTNYTITSGKNAMSAGPIEIDNNVTITIPLNSNWVIV